jgi:hypothetical protein
VAATHPLRHDLHFRDEIAEAVAALDDGNAKFTFDFLDCQR